MPNRQIPWRRLAQRFGGEFHIRTGATRSAFYLDAEVRGTTIEIRGTSVPYSLTGGTTKIRAIAERSLGVVLKVNRFGSVRSFFLRDVIVGDECFDRDWVIHARRESQAQAFLGEEERALLDKVGSRSVGNGNRNQAMPRLGQDLLPTHYNFEARGRAAMARFDGFETDEERLFAAVSATIALAQRPTSLLEQWRKLASDLDGRLEVAGGWQDDGSTRIVLASAGVRVTVSPVADKLGWRRLRLRTRVLCECGEGLPLLHYTPGDRESGLDTKILSGTNAAEIVVLRCDGKRIWIDLDGNVCDASRIRAAVQVVARLALPASQAGPYR